MTKTHDASLEQRLLEAGLVSAKLLGDLREEAQRHDLSLGEALVERDLVDERRLFLLIAEHCGMRLAEAEELLARLDSQLIGSVPARYRDRKRLLPIAREGESLLVASCDPAPRTLDLADAMDATEIEIALVTPTDFRRLRWAATLGQIRAQELDARPERMREFLAQDPDVDSRHVSLIDALLVDAVGERASDVHLERYAGQVRVRLRIDGDLHDVDRYHLSDADAQAMISVVKIRARLDIAERRRPQGGRFSEQIAGRHFDLRAQTLPSLHGEGLALRFLPQQRERFTLESLGFSERLREQAHGVLEAPSGLVLVAGPTGCGKSTTLYAGLQRLAGDARRKVITVEDPIEYAIEGIHQTQVLPSIGYTFASSVRSFVRHDPDVIFVGEIRDHETALEALRASQTGHLVLSTIHANDAVDAIQRLYDLGVHPNSISAELRAIFSQRLLKRVCPACAAPEQVDPRVLRTLFPKGPPDDFRSLAGAGCERCRQRGHHGRIAVAEFLVSTRDLRIAIAHTRPLDELREIAALGGLTPMREHALELVAEGLTSASQLPRSIPYEMLQPS